METEKERSLKKAFQRVKEDNLFLLQKIESLEERVSTQENMLKESFELLREQIEIYKAESSIAELNKFAQSRKAGSNSKKSKDKDKIMTNNVNK